MVIGSKLDLAETQRQIPTEHGVQIAEKNNFNKFLEISAKDNLNVDKAFRILTEFTIQNMQKKINSI